MSNLKILVLAILSNPTCTNWIYGFKSLGYKVVVLNHKKSPSTKEELKRWGFSNNDVPIFTIDNELSEETKQAVLDLLGGTPDVLFSWEGALILKPLPKVCQSFPTAKVVHSVNTYPNAIGALTEIRMNWRYSRANPLISAYVFYSENQRKLFSQKISLASNKPYLVMLEPFFEKAFAHNGIPHSEVIKLERFDRNPHIIFTGRATKLWNKYDLRGRRDALGSFLSKLAEHDIHNFLSPQANTKGLPNLHSYPKFTNKDIFEGRFANYISQFDAHLVMYNEYNDTMRRWVHSGLATRFAYALTATAPIAVTETSKFVEELWQDTPFGFTFRDIESLAESLHDRHRLKLLRHNMEKVHKLYSFESQSKRVSQFFEKIADI